MIQSILIASENDKLMNNDEVLCLSFDDHSKHTKAHFDFLKNVSVTPEQQDRFLNHIAEHNAMLQQAQHAVPVTKFKVGDRIKYHSVKEYGVICNSYKSSIEDYFTVKWDNAVLTQDFDANVIGCYLELVGNTPAPGQSTIHNPLTVSPMNRLQIAEELLNRGFIKTQEDYISILNGIKPISCCSNSQNIKYYVNFYDKKVKYCNCCGNDVK